MRGIGHDVGKKASVTFALIMAGLIISHVAAASPTSGPSILSSRAEGSLVVVTLGNPTGNVLTGNVSAHADTTSGEEGRDARFVLPPGGEIRVHLPFSAPVAAITELGVILDDNVPF